MQLEPLELAVLEKLLEGSHPALQALRQQLMGIAVKERQKTGSGFMTRLQVTSSASRAPVETDKVRFGDVHATLPGLAAGAGFLLYVDGGFIRALEGYSFEEPWPNNTSKFELKYNNHDRSQELRKLN